MLQNSQEVNRMNSHKNARTTFERRKLLIERISTMGLKSAAQSAGISERTARKWFKRFEDLGTQNLLDRSSRPVKTRTSVNAHLAERIERLRRHRMPMRRIAPVVGRSVATVSRLLARLELSSLKALEPVQTVLRYEWSAPGELLHMDTKNLGRIEQVGHRIHGDKSSRSRGAGWEAHVAIDDHSCAGFVQMLDDERKDSAVAFLQAAVAHYATLGVKIKRQLTDNGPAIQTCLREWAYGRAWSHSTERTAWLPAFLSYYNARRPHSALGHKPPASRLGGNNLLQLNRYWQRI